MSQAAFPAAREMDVAAAVIERADGRFLLAQRPAGKVYAGYWEFPGGKVEPGEPVRSALDRELREELGIDVEIAYPWVTRVYTYPHGTVRLHFHRVVQWRGEPHPHEGQALAWQRNGFADVAPMLPANAPVLKALSLPLICAVTHAWETGVQPALEALDRAIDRGLRLVQVRERALPTTQRREFARQVVRRMRTVHGMTIVNDSVEEAVRLEADGVQVPARELIVTSKLPSPGWRGASCHDETELARAVDAGADFALLGPVRETPSHPGQTGLGWERFSSLVQGYPLPVFAIGGLRMEDLNVARTAGAHGIAMVRAAWEKTAAGAQGSFA